MIRSETSPVLRPRLRSNHTPSLGLCRAPIPPIHAGDVFSFLSPPPPWPSRSRIASASVPPRRAKSSSSATMTASASTASGRQANGPASPPPGPAHGPQPGWCTQRAVLTLCCPEHGPVLPGRARACGNQESDPLAFLLLFGIRRWMEEASFLS